MLYNINHMYHTINLYEVIKLAMIQMNYTQQDWPVLLKFNVYTNSNYSMKHIISINFCSFWKKVC